MNKLISAIISVVAICLLANVAHGLSGSWRGSLDLAQAKLPLTFNFTEMPSGETHCTMDSPAQGAKGIPTEVLLCTSDTISLKCNAIMASYTGKISGGTIKGVFSQRGFAIPLNLTADNPGENRRPQTPVPPFPYSAIDTTFTAQDGAVMAATLTMPPNATGKKVPAVVMVTGSGPQNRDEECFEHKPFAVIADYLARNGIASLRYDDRGTAKSTGDFSSATTFTFKDDALSAIEFLRSIGAIGPVGVLGHSEGGTIAFIIGSEGKADFIISLAGMAISGKETMMRQNEQSLNKLNLSQADKANSLKLIDLLFDEMASQTKQGISTPINIDELAAKNNLSVPLMVTQSLKMSQKTRSPWLNTFVVLNPREFLGKVKCPVLAINGAKDTQVHPDNLKVISDYIPRAETRLMPGLNHLLQHAETGEVSEYNEIRETISPEVLATLPRFITTTTK